MCDLSTLNLIVEVIEQKIINQEMFTAFDVSTEVQKKAKNQSIPIERHRNMKNDIHQEMQQYLHAGMYKSQLHDVGAQMQAILYFPDNSDPNNYIPQKRKDNSLGVVIKGNTKPIIPACAVVDGKLKLVDTTSQDISDSQKAGRSPDQRGTLTVPNNLLQNAGLKPRMTAFVFLRPQDDLLFVTKNVHDRKYEAVYTVDYAGNVRITKSILKLIGDDNSTYDFERNADEVIVKVHK